MFAGWLLNWSWGRLGGRQLTGWFTTFVTHSIVFHVPVWWHHDRNTFVGHQPRNYHAHVSEWPLHSYILTRLQCWLVTCLFACLVAWPADSLINWLGDWSVGCLDIWMRWPRNFGFNASTFGYSQWLLLWFLVRTTGIMSPDWRLFCLLISNRDGCSKEPSSWLVTFETCT